MSVYAPEKLSRAKPWKASPLPGTVMLLRKMGAGVCVGVALEDVADVDVGVVEALRGWVSNLVFLSAMHEPYLAVVLVAAGAELSDFDFVDATAPPTPPPTAAATMMRSTASRMRNPLRLIPKIFFLPPPFSDGGGGNEAPAPAPPIVDAPAAVDGCRLWCSECPSSTVVELSPHGAE